MWMYSPKLWIAIAVILILLLGWDYLWTELPYLIAGSTETTAIITQCDINRSRRSTNSRTIFTYEYIADNITYNSVFMVGGLECNGQYKIGDTLQITYQNNNPEISRVKGTDAPLVSLPCIIGFVVILMLVAPYLMRQGRYRTQD